MDIKGKCSVATQDMLFTSSIVVIMFSLICVQTERLSVHTDSHLPLFTGAVGHHGDNLVEKILSVLNPLPGHVTDVQVDMLELTSVQRTPHSQNTVAHGCLAQTQ